VSKRDDDDRTARQIARSKQKRAGDRSAAVAAQLMKLADAAVKKLEVDEDTRDAIDRARKTTTHIARRRAERTLAGDLRRFDNLGEIEDQLARIEETGNANVRQFHLAEQWRTRLIEGTAKVEEVPGADDELPRLLDAARRERDTGKPPGAARTLFRHIMKLLETR
jgi:ribosome-associated protein